MLITNYDISCYPSETNNPMILHLFLGNDYPEYKEHVVLTDYNHKISLEEVDELYYPNGYMIEVSYDLKSSHIHQPKWRTLTGELFYVGDNDLVPCRSTTKEELELIKSYIKENQQQLHRMVDLEKIKTLNAKRNIA